MRTSLFVNAAALPNIEGMELDPTKLQLIFNVTMITGVTTLALVCRLLKRDNQKLAVELLSRQTPALRGVSSASVPDPSAPKQKALERKAVRIAPRAVPVAQQDIREFVAQRVHGWTVSSATRAC